MRRRAQSLPQIAAQAGYTRTNHVEAFSVPSPGSTVPRILYPDIPDNYRSRLDLQWSFYNGGRLAAFERAAYRESEALVADRRVTEGDLRLDIARAYWTLVAAIEHVRVVEQSIVRTQTHLNDARSRLDAGVIAPYYLLSGATLARDVAAGELVTLADLDGVPAAALDAYLSGLALGA